MTITELRLHFIDFVLTNFIKTSQYSFQKLLPGKKCVNELFTDPSVSSKHLHFTTIDMTT